MTIIPYYSILILSSFPFIHGDPSASLLSVIHHGSPLTYPSHPLILPIQDYWRINLSNGNGTTLLIQRDQRLSFNQQNQLLNILTTLQHQSFVIVDTDEVSLEPSSFLSLLSIPCQRGLLPSSIPHTVFVCRSLQGTLNHIQYQHHHPQLFLPTIFASAKSTNRKAKKEESEVDEEEEERGRNRLSCKYRKSCYESGKIPEKLHPDQPINQPQQQQHEDEENQNGLNHKKKLRCKYRNSCYESGQLPEQLNPPSKMTTKEQDNEDEKEEKTEDERDSKLKCKYRKRCYVEKGMMDEEQVKKEKEEQENRPRKKTIKEIAQRALNKAQVQEERAKEEYRPSTATIAQQTMAENEEKLSKKLECKYRKSCYDNGQKPHIEPSFNFDFIPSLTSFSSQEDGQEDVSFDEMNEQSKKFHCRYRRSCYDNGIRPPTEDYQPLSIIQSLHIPTIETIHQSPQLQCKYRKSCYETGDVADIEPLWIPSFSLWSLTQDKTNVQMKADTDTVRNFCKYRKSCYGSIAEAEESRDKVNEIKEQRIQEKRRMEKEKRQRRNRKDKMEKEARKEKKEREEKETRKEKKEREEKETRKEKKEREEKETRKEKKEREEEETRKEKKEREEKETRKEKKERGEEETRKEKKERGEEERGQEQVKDINVQETKKRQKERNEEKKKEEEEQQDDKGEQEEVKEEQNKEKKKRKNVKKQMKITVPVPEEKEEKEDEEEKEERIEKDEEDEEEKEEKGKEEKIENKDEGEEEIVEKVHVKIDEKERTKGGEEKKHIKGSKKYIQLPKEDTKEFCKYRKSCYESGEPPVIKKSSTSLFETLFEMAEKEYAQGEDEEESDDHLSVRKKLRCKYRKSCYETGLIPEVLNPSHHISSHTQSTEESSPSSASDPRLTCKYRKSCYLSGKVPENLHPEMVMREEKEVKIVVDPRLQCKYRKSCYQDEKMEDQEKEQVKQQQHNKRHKGKEEEKDDQDKEEKDDEDKEEKQVKRKKHVKKEEPKEVEKMIGVEQKKRSIHKKKEEAQKKEERNKEILTPLHGHEKKKEFNISLSVEQKLDCKYRTSCYEDHPPVVKQHPLTSSTPSSAPVRCHKYLLSCRTQLGLPPKEKVPIGPSGRKLCRKIKE